MSEEFFYHYTSVSGATAIFLTGKITPSLRANGTTVHSDGVYLTTVDPILGKETVGKNNWFGAVGSSCGKMMERYFEILIPSKMVRRAKTMRNIQVYTGGELRLADYKWSLKSWKGELLATQYYMVSSEGGAARVHSRKMGCLLYTSDAADE